ncbi:MAG: AbrB/MazE/SpoVT family DNA-binding domain-containing protein [Deltaproteobacteria bacterium]|nr:AbrB/MazE/SpoVT family DNA-binding domain-containing protein [Deltaproteobacteria bacterium]
MPTTITLTGKGQITIPKEIRDKVGLRPGDTLSASIDSQGRIVLLAARIEPEELFRDRPPVTRVVSLDEMQEAIVRGARGRS